MAEPTRGDGPRPGEFVWIAGDPVGDFVNTVTWRRSGPTRERFGSIADVIAWAGQALALESADALQRYAARHPRKAARAFERVIRLRTTLHTLLVAAAAGEPLAPGALDEFNDALHWSLGRARLAGTHRVGWEWDCPGNPLNEVRHRIIQSATRLLTSDDVGLLRRCANPECGWVFLDRSRKRNRRWCSLACSSRDKSRRYYARKRSRVVPATAENARHDQEQRAGARPDSR